MSTTGAGGHVQGFGQTWRKDSWWVGPAVSAGVFTAWVIYYTFAALQAKYYAVGPYISPFYAPLLFSDPSQPGSASAEHAFFGSWPTWWPEAIPPSPAIFIFIFPAAFRMTCYYYRKMYYRSFFGLPPGCAVGPMSYGGYEGETGLLIFQNLHRYALYFAIALLPFLFYEGVMSFFLHGKPGVGIGSILILGNAIALTGYTLGCHSWRHLIGGKLNCFSCDAVAETRHGLWGRVSWLNARHMQFAWISLIWIAVADIYIRLVSAGFIPDLNTWHGITWAGDF
jgi:hypothetical protein